MHSLRCKKSNAGFILSAMGCPSTSTEPTHLGIMQQCKGEILTPPKPSRCDLVIRGLSLHAVHIIQADMTAELLSLPCLVAWQTLRD